MEVEAEAGVKVEAIPSLKSCNKLPCFLAPSTLISLRADGLKQLAVSGWAGLGLGLGLGLDLARQSCVVGCVGAGLCWALLGFGLRAGKAQLGWRFALHVAPAVDPAARKGAVDLRQFTGPGTLTKNACRSPGKLSSLLLS